MRRFRVGTLSMGLVLIVFGVLLLLAQFNGVSALNFALKWWPLIFILLGVEVLWHVYSSKEETPKVKYDVFSMIMIFLIVLCGLGIWSLTEIGIVPQLSKMVSAQRYQLKTQFTEIALENSVKKIFIEAPGCEVRVHAGGGNSIAATATADLTADSQETAEQLLAASEINSRRLGDTIYISFDFPLPGGDFGYQARIIKYDLVIPGDRAVEINEARSLVVHADQLKNNWVVDGTDIEIRVPGSADLKIEGLVDEEDYLLGNVDWKITRPSTELGGPYKTRGELVLGTGRYKLSIINRRGGRLAVNKIS